MSWREFWNADTPIYVNERHKTLHYAGIARDIAALVPHAAAAVLDHGCGEALGADRVAAACRVLYLCDGAPLVRDRLRGRFAAETRVVVLSPEALDAAVPDGSLDLVVVNSLLQYLSHDELTDLIGLWRSKLSDEGRLVLADVIPPSVGPLADTRALLSFAWTGGFLRAALAGLVRTALSDYRTLRAELGLAQYEAAEITDLLGERGFAVERRTRNIGHNQARMTFVARPV